MSTVATAAPLSSRLRALVVQHAGSATLTCTFEPGGKHNGVGIASVLWCRTCGQARMWHDVAAGAALAQRVEDSERFPFMRGVNEDDVRQFESMLVRGVERA